MIDLTSLPKLGRLSVAAYQDRRAPQPSEDPQPSSGSFIAGGIFGGLAASALLYRRLPTSARIGLAKGISKFWRAPTIEQSIASTGAFRGLPSAAADLLQLQYNTKNFSPSALREALTALENVTAESSTKNLASLQDLLGSTGIANTAKSHLSIATSNYALRAGVDVKRLLRLPAGEGVVKEAGQIIDYRARTVGGIIANALEFAHRNIKIPLTNFAPTDIFLHKAWANQYNAAILGKGSKVGGISLPDGAIAVGKSLIGRQGTIHTFDKPLHILQENTSLATSAHIMAGTQKFKSPEKLLAEGDYGFLSRMVLKLQGKSNAGSLSGANKAKYEALISAERWEDAANLLEKEGSSNSFLFSPGFARQHSSARQGRVKFQRLVSGNIKFKNKPITDPSNTPKYTEADLSLFEKYVAKPLRMDTDKFTWVDDTGRVIGSGSMGPIKGRGYQNVAPGAFPEDVVQEYGQNQVKGLVPNTHTAVTGYDFLRAFGHFLVERPIRLFEPLTGLGIKPSDSLVKTALMSTAGAGMLLYGAYEAAQYTNFLGLGVPGKVAGAVLGGAQIGVSAAKDVTGITTAARTMEELFPGSVNSFASQLLRGAGLPILGANLGERFIPELNLTKFQLLRQVGEQLSIKSITGRQMGGALGVGLALASYLVDPTQYSAETIDEVTGERKVPIRNAKLWIAGRQPFGGDRIKYHDYSIAHKLWTAGAADNTTYGSETQRWMHSALPTPTNLFGIIPLLDPYYAERHNQELSPYPVISPGGSNMPVIGPLVGATVGQIFKPGVEFDIEGAPVGEYGVPGAAEALGYGSMAGTIDPGSPSMMHQQISNLQDYAGLFGFLSEFPMKALTGSGTGFGGGSQLEESSNRTSPGRELAEMNFGGLFGTTEFLRRMFPERSGNVNYYNPIRNAAPMWLPGSGSAFEGDIDFRTDFHQGDLYTKVERGETRLPGPGYESETGLHGTDGYDYVDIYNILSDVAPGSQAHAHYRDLVTKDIKGGTADEATQSTYHNRELENQERLAGKYKFTSYAGSPATSTSMGDQIKEYLGYININIAQTPGHPILAPLQMAWDQASHFNVPGFGQIPGTSWIQGKFLHNRTPYEEYMNTQVTQSEFADWTRPYESFIQPLGHQLYDFATPGSTFIPAHVEQRREIEEYYDKLKYLKARRLQMRAQELGNEDLAGTYGAQAGETVVGIPYSATGINKNIYEAVPASQRPFVSAIAQATPSEISRFRNVLPVHQRNMWEQIWASNQNQGYAPPEDNATQRADEEVSEYFSRRSLPSSESNVWNPDVSLDEYKIKTFEQEELTYFEEGIPEANAREFRELGRADLIIDTSPFSQDIGFRNSLMEELQRNKSVAGYNTRSSMIPKSSRVYYDDPRRREMYDRAGAGGRF